MQKYTTQFAIMMIDEANSNEDILGRLDAMRVQEETIRCNNYFRGRKGDIDEACRGSMATWIQQVQRTLFLSPETVWIAMSFFDRYLSSGDGRSTEVLNSKREFQLAAIAAFYTAVKIHEPVVLGIDMVLTICRGTYTELDITRMEVEILKALNWRVATHTPMDVVAHLLRLIPEDQLEPKISDALLNECQMQLDNAISDIYLTYARTTDIGAGCLASSLAECKMLSSSEKRAIWTRLSKECHFATYSEAVVAAQRRFLSDVPSSILHNVLSKKSQQSDASVSAYTVDSESSPVCVAQSARQA